MIISDTRLYFKNEIEKCFPDSSEWDDYFNLDNVPSTIQDCTYHIGIGPLSTGRKNDQTSEEDLSVTVNFWKKGYNDVQETFDEFFDSVHEFKTCVTDPSTYASHAFIKDVYATSIVPQPIDGSNDNVLRLSIDFSVLSFWCKD